MHKIIHKNARYFQHTQSIVLPAKLTEMKLNLSKMSLLKNVSLVA